VADPEPNSASRPPSWGERLTLLLLRWAIIAAVAWAALLVPLPVLEGWLPVKDALIVAGAIFWMGKTLYDTLYYDRYWP